MKTFKFDFKMEIDIDNLHTNTLKELEHENLPDNLNKDDLIKWINQTKVGNIFFPEALAKLLQTHKSFHYLKQDVFQNHYLLHYGEISYTNPYNLLLSKYNYKGFFNTYIINDKLLFLCKSIKEQKLKDFPIGVLKDPDSSVKTMLATLQSHQVLTFECKEKLYLNLQVPHFGEVIAIDGSADSIIIIDVVNYPYEWRKQFDPASSQFLTTYRMLYDTNLKQFINCEPLLLTSQLVQALGEYVDSVIEQSKQLKAKQDNALQILTIKIKQTEQYLEELKQQKQALELQKQKEN